MDKLTKEQAIILTGFTGVACGKFSDFYEDVEKRLGKPITTLGLGIRAKEIKELYRADFLRMMPRLEVKK